MQWIAPSAKDDATNTLEKRLWDAADQMRANSGLSSQQYSAPVLGLIFLRFAEVRFAKRRAELEKQAAGGRRGSRVDDPAAYHAEGVLFLAPDTRFDFLLALPEGANIGSKVNEAMRRIERDNPQVAGVLPKTYELFSSSLMKQLLKRVSEISATLDYDAFGRIYEYFLGEFARKEGQKGGEFFTPASIVRFLVEVIEPYHGAVFDPATGSGGMFVQSARFVSEHKKDPSREIPCSSEAREIFRSFHNEAVYLRNGQFRSIEGELGRWRENAIRVAGGQCIADALVKGDDLDNILLTPEHAHRGVTIARWSHLHSIAMLNRGMTERRWQQVETLQNLLLRYQGQVTLRDLHRRHGFAPKEVKSLVAEYRDRLSVEVAKPVTGRPSEILTFPKQ